MADQATRDRRKRARQRKGELKGRYRLVAQGLYEAVDPENVMIDDDAGVDLVPMAEGGGGWVQAWVYVSPGDLEGVVDPPAEFVEAQP